MLSDLWTTRTVAAGVFAVMFTMILVLCFVEVPKANHDIIVALAGAMTTAALSIVNFYFGSSSSSRAKDETIKQVLTGTGDGK